ncbi:MAG TPA: TIGR04282 family arsenosugar biosynthesis glycosyltransferase [Candidatus Nitrosotenuis sp.]|nr:TIGR04282 family arsenosugar biosynthesis glycosyltransferase [Candidatus Nitrosotenuis sp.]
MSKPPRALIVFSKPAVPGRVKTRMLTALTPRQAADLHLACLRDTLSAAARLQHLKKTLCVAADASSARTLASQLRLGKSWRVRIQRGRDLGARMGSAIREELSRGARHVVIIGTDTPWLDARRIAAAFRALEQADVVLGPARDGGYYLVGARRVVPEMFRAIAWGTDKVLSETLARLQATRTSCFLLEEDFDLDVPDDLTRAAQLLQAGARAPHLRRWLTKWRAAQSSRRPAPRRRRKTRRPARA